MGNVPPVLVEANSWKLTTKGFQGREVILYSLWESAVKHTRFSRHLPLTLPTPFLSSHSVHITFHDNYDHYY